MNGKLKKIRQRLKTEATVYRLAMNDSRTPRSARWLLWLALGYLALPFDLIPDFIPVLGVMDDLFIVPGLIYLALQQIPDEVIREIRADI